METGDGDNPNSALSIKKINSSTALQVSLSVWHITWIRDFLEQQNSPNYIQTPIHA